MARKSKTESTTTEPKFPYTPTPGSLRKFLKLVPNKPKPDKVTFGLLKSWGLTSSNDRYIMSVLKALNFIGSSGQPTENYEAFMHRATGSATIGAQIKRVYAPFFQASHEPAKEGHEDLKRLFNIHSGGSERTIRYQLETFKALCEFASFEDLPKATRGRPEDEERARTSGVSSHQGLQINESPAIHIDLHIHLPENKTAREYEAIIQDIARYIYKHEVTSDGR